MTKTEALIVRLIYRIVKALFLETRAELNAELAQIQSDIEGVFDESVWRR